MPTYAATHNLISIFSFFQVFFVVAVKSRAGSKDQRLDHVFTTMSGTFSKSSDYSKKSLTY